MELKNKLEMEFELELKFTPTLIRSDAVVILIELTKQWLQCVVTVISLF